MSTLLLPDIINLIIDELADNPQSVGDLKSCGLASRSFVGPCQRLIFGTEDLSNTGNRLYPEGHDIGESCYPVQKRAQAEWLQEMSCLFVDALASKACLGPLVRNLRHHFDKRCTRIEASDWAFGNVIRALQSMVRISEFTMDYQGRGDSPLTPPSKLRKLRFQDCAVEWQKAVIPIIQSLSLCLKSLKLNRIQGFPLSLSFQCPSLEVLILHNSAFVDRLPKWFKQSVHQKL